MSKEVKEDEGSAASEASGQNFIQKKLLISFLTENKKFNWRSNGTHKQTGRQTDFPPLEAGFRLVTLYKNSRSVLIKIGVK